MQQNEKTGILLCTLTNGYSGDINMDEIEKKAINHPDVNIVWKSSGIDISNPDAFTEQLKNNDIKRIIIAGFETGFYKPFIARVAYMAGLSTEQIFTADFKEFGALYLHNTDRAMAILESAVYGVPFEFSALPDENPVKQETLVIGGGIAGIQASLEIANAGYKVYLVEKTGTIGGHMAMFDKTFPTLDCAACILTPKMVEVGQHPNIELMSYSEVTGVEGNPGDYDVKVLKKARRVDLAKCIGCGECSMKCPAKAPSEFDAGTTMRKAIYIPFPQAVPNKYLIDAESCIYVQKGKCGVCKKACPADCIDLDEKDQEITVNVGNIIVATGFEVFDALKIDKYGYGKYPNVLTSLEFERLINAAGPTSGSITFRTQDKKGNWIFEPDKGEPESLALIHCIGSRDENHNKYCSRVCCMYSLKLAHLIKEKLPKAEVNEYYIDMRAFGKGYEEFYERIKDEGVNIIRGRTAKVENKNGKLILRSEDILNDKIIEQEVDMVVLAVGLEPRKDSNKVAEMLGIQHSEDGWFTEKHNVFNTTDTFSGGITIAGVCQGPKDIPDSVAQGSAAAARVLNSIIKGKIKQSTKEMSFDEIVTKAKKISTIMEE